MPEKATIDKKDGPKPGAKPKRTRAYAPKVRTGCITCKKFSLLARIRRKKCDEERPTCLRCREGGWKCDGYAPITKRSPNKGTVENERDGGSSSSGKDSPGDSTDDEVIGKLPTTQSPAKRPRATIPLLPRPMNITTRDTLLERRFLGHFFKFTLNNISSSYNTGNFWLWTLPNLIQNQQLIRHSITALGAAHWMFQGDGFTTPNQVAQCNAFIHKQYNMALSHLIPIMSNDDSENIQLVLVSCLLFVYLETLRGHHAEALRHLISGQKLLKHLRTKESMENIAGTGVFSQIATLFRALGTAVNMFNEDRILSDLRVYAKPVHGPNDPSKPYDSLEKAMDELTLLDMDLSDIQYSKEESIDKSPEQEREREQLVYNTIKDRYQVWEKRFEQTIKALSPPEDFELLNLKLQQAMWQCMLGDSFEDEPELAADECWPLLDLIERLLVMTPSTQRTFALRADLIPPLIGIYGTCKDFSVRRRAITLLRLRRRKEVVWDSDEAADFLDNDLKMCLVGLKAPSWPDIGPCAGKNALLSFDPHNI